MREYLIGHRRQIALFVAGGVVSALADIGAMYLLIGRGIHYSLATSAGFALGLLVNYAFHATLTFRESGNATSFLRYLCVVGLNYLLTIGCVALAASLAGNPLAGKLLSLPLVAFNGYLLGKYWIFK